LTEPQKKFNIWDAIHTFITPKAATAQHTLQAHGKYTKFGLQDSEQ